MSEGERVSSWFSADLHYRNLRGGRSEPEGAFTLYLDKCLEHISQRAQKLESEGVSTSQIDLA